jgi:hypothetical protein
MAKRCEICNQEYSETHPSCPYCHGQEEPATVAGPVPVEFSEPGSGEELPRGGWLEEEEPLAADVHPEEAGSQSVETMGDTVEPKAEEVGDEGEETRTFSPPADGGEGAEPLEEDAGRELFPSIADTQPPRLPPKRQKAPSQEPEAGAAGDPRGKTRDREERVKGKPARSGRALVLGTLLGVAISGAGFGGMVGAGLVKVFPDESPPTTPRADLQAALTARAEAEKAQQAAEERRQVAERAREAAEKQRDVEETARKQADQAKKQAETAKKQAEQELTRAQGQITQLSQTTADVAAELKAPQDRQGIVGAIKDLKKRLPHEPTTVAEILQAGREQLAAGRLEQAAEVLKRKPMGTPAPAMLADLQAERGRARWLGYLTQTARDNREPRATDEEVVEAVKDLKNARTALAMFWLGQIAETTGNLVEARRFYEEGFKEYKEGRFESALQQLSRREPAPMKSSRLFLPRSAPWVALALVGLQGGDVKLEVPEAGALFLKALEDADRGKYDDAISKLKEAVKLHQRRSRLYPTVRLNPTSDQGEHIFGLCCKQLESYWRMRELLATKSGPVPPRVDAPTKDQLEPLTRLVKVASEASAQTLKEVAEALSLKKEKPTLLDVRMAVEKLKTAQSTLGQVAGKLKFEGNNWDQKKLLSRLDEVIDTAGKGAATVLNSIADRMKLPKEKRGLNEVIAGVEKLQGSEGTLGQVADKLGLAANARGEKQVIDSLTTVQKARTTAETKLKTAQADLLTAETKLKTAQADLVTAEGKVTALAKELEVPGQKPEKEKLVKAVTDLKTARQTALTDRQKAEGTIRAVATELPSEKTEKDMLAAIKDLKKRAQSPAKPPQPTTAAEIVKAGREHLDTGRLALAWEVLKNKPTDTPAPRLQAEVQELRGETLWLLYLQQTARANGTLKRQDREVKESVKALEEANTPRAWFWLGQVEEQTGNQEKALERYKEGRKRFPAEKTLFESPIRELERVRRTPAPGGQARGPGLLPLGLVALQSAPGAGESDPGKLFRQAILEAQDGKYEQARETLEKAMKGHEQWRRLHFQRLYPRTDPFNDYYLESGRELAKAWKGIDSLARMNADLKKANGDLTKGNAVLKKANVDLTKGNAELKKSNAAAVLLATAIRAELMREKLLSPGQDPADAFKTFVAGCRETKQTVRALADLLGVSPARQEIVQGVQRLRATTCTSATKFYDAITAELKSAGSLTPAQTDPVLGTRVLVREWKQAVAAARKAEQARQKAEQAQMQTEKVRRQALADQEKAQDESRKADEARLVAEAARRKAEVALKEAQRGIVQVERKAGETIKKAEAEARIVVAKAEQDARLAIGKAQQNASDAITRADQQRQQALVARQKALEEARVLAVAREQAEKRLRSTTAERDQILTERNGLRKTLDAVAEHLGARPEEDILLREVGRLRQRHPTEDLLLLWAVLLRDPDRASLAREALADADAVLLVPANTPVARENRARALHVRALALCMQGDPGEARRALTEALALEGQPKPGDWRGEARALLTELTPVETWHFRRAAILRRDGHLGAALAILDAGLQRLPQQRDELLALRGLVRLDLAQKQDGSVGEALVKQAAEDAQSAADNGSALGHSAAGRVAEVLADWPVAEKHFRAALTAGLTGEAGAECRLALARVLARGVVLPDRQAGVVGPRERDIEPALKEALRLAEESGQPEGHLLRARILVASRSWPAVLKEYALAGRDAWQSRRPALATEIQTGLDLCPLFDRKPVSPRPDPGLAEQHFFRGQKWYFSGRFAQAESEFARAVYHDAQDARFWYFLGLAQLGQGQPVRAEESFQSGSKQERLNRPTSRVIGLSLERVQGEPREALNKFRKDLR